MPRQKHSSPEHPDFEASLVPNIKTSKYIHPKSNKDTMVTTLLSVLAPPSPRRQSGESQQNSANTGTRETKSKR